MDSCHSGGIAQELIDFLSNTAAIAACSAKDVTQFTCNAGSNDGLSIFTSAIIANLDHGVFDLHQIAVNIAADAFGVYESDIGMNLSLEDSGSAVFTGLTPQFWERAGFRSNFTNNFVSFLQPLAAISQPTITNGSFQSTLINLPPEHAVAIELSTNLISWLQVAFYPAAGTNITFTFPTTNITAAFFRGIAVQ